MNTLIQEINKLYGLNVFSFEKVTKGCLSENHILNDGVKRYFLKKYRFDNKEKIEEIHSVKKYFSDGGIPVILPIKNMEGKTYFIFEEGYYAIFPFVSRRQLDRGLLKDKAVISLGEMLARIHLLGKNANISIKGDFKDWNKKKALDKIELIEVEIKKVIKLTELDNLFIENLNLKKNLINKNLLTQIDTYLPADHLIHGDYLDHNVFFDDQDQVSDVFDFEKTNYSPRTYELFRSMMYAFIGSEVTKQDVAKMKLYLNSYLNVYPTSKEELSRGLRLYYAKNIHSIWIESEHYLENNNRVDGFIQSDISRIKYLSSNFSNFEKELFDE